MKIMILGANGYIGTPLTKKLEEKHEVITITRTPNNNNNNNNYAIKSNTLKEYLEQVKPIITKEQPEVILSLVWQGSTGAERNDVSLQKDSSEFTVELYEFANENNIFFATAGTISECEVDYIENPMQYAIWKRKTHDKLFELDPTGKSFLWLRLGNIFGGYDNTGRFVVSLTRSLIQNKEYKINSNGKQRFNGVYIDGAVLDMTQLIQSKTSGVRFIGSDETVTLQKFVRALEREIEFAGFTVTPVEFGKQKVANMDAKLFNRSRGLPKRPMNLSRLVQDEVRRMADDSE